MRLYVATNGGKLVADDLVGDEGFAKGVSLAGVFKRLGETSASFAVAADGHDEALFIEVRHYDAEALVFTADQILNGDVYVVELDEASAAALLPAVGDAAVGDAGCVRRDHEDGDSSHAWTAGADGRGHMGGPWHACDPLLVAIHDVVFAVRGFLGGGLDVGDVGLDWC